MSISDQSSIGGIKESSLTQHGSTTTNWFLNAREGMLRSFNNREKYPASPRAGSERPVVQELNRRVKQNEFAPTAAPSGFAQVLFYRSFRNVRVPTSAWSCSSRGAHSAEIQREKREQHLYHLRLKHYAPSLTRIHPLTRQSRPVG